MSVPCFGDIILSLRNNVALPLCFIHGWRGNTFVVENAEESADGSASKMSSAAKEWISPDSFSCMRYSLPSSVVGSNKIVTGIYLFSF